MARKKQRTITDILGSMPRKRARPCQTCSNEGWARVVRESLEAMRDGVIDKVSVTQLAATLTDPEIAAELKIDVYSFSVAGLGNHLRRCEMELWNAVQAISEAEWALRREARDSGGRDRESG